MSDSYFIRRGANILGPLSLDKIRALCSAGKIKPADQISRDQRNWTTVEALEQKLNGPPAEVAPASTPNHDYWAFISYSSVDRAFAQRLHQSIESYGVPSKLQRHVTPWGERVPKRIRPVFCDREELHASSDLGREIENALRASRFLIVICSPDSAKSHWVNREIETFRRVSSPDRILALILRGTPNSGDVHECFPPSLRLSEPIAADARKTGDGLRNARLKLLAAMLGVKYDVLKQRDDRRRKVQRRVATSVASILLFSFIAVGWYARNQQAIAETNAAAATAGAEAAAVADKNRLAAEAEGAVAERLRREAELNRRRQVYIDSVVRMQNAAKGGDVAQLRTLLDRTQPGPEPDAIDFRGFEWFYFQRLAYPTEATLESPAPLGTLSWTSGGRTLFATDFAGRLLKTNGAQDALVEVRPAESSSLRVAAATAADRIAVVRTRRGEEWGRSIKVVTSDDRTVSDIPLNMPPSAAALTSDGRMLAVGDLAGGVYLFDAATGRELLDLTGGPQARRSIQNPLQTMDRHADGVSALAFSPDGKLLVSGGVDSLLLVWDTASGKCKAVLTQHENAVSGVAFSPDGSKFVSRSLPGVRGTTPVPAELFVWQTASGALIKRIALAGEFSSSKTSETGRGVSALERTTPNVEFLADGERIVAGFGNMVGIWNALSGETVRELKGHVARITCVKASPDGSRLASADEAGVLNFWNLSESSAESHLAKMHSAARGFAVRSSFGSAALLDAGAVLIVGRGQRHEPVENKLLTVFDVAGDQLKAPQEFQQIYFCLAASPSGRRLAAADSDGGIRVWDAVAGKVEFHIQAADLDAQERWTSLAFRSDDELYGVSNSVTRRFHFATGQAVAADIAPITEPGERAAPHAWKPEPRCVMALAFSADGLRAAAGKADGDVVLYDLTDWREPSKPWPKVGSFRAHSRGVTGLSFSKVGERLASCSGRYCWYHLIEPNTDPGELIVWDTHGLQPLMTLHEPTPSEFAGVGFSDDGRTLFAAANPTGPGSDGTTQGNIVVWKSSRAPAKPK